jgi:acylphosphatase
MGQLPPATRSVQVRIEGLVQGVGYRAWMEVMATELGIEGWVRNRRDGSVEALLSGSVEEVAELLRLCRRGPSAARVDAIEVVGEGVKADPGFSVRPTA